MAQSKVDLLIEQRDSIKSGRGNWDNLNQEISEYLLPRKAEFNRVWAAGEERNIELYDSTAVDALNLLASGLHGLMTNPAQAWIQFTRLRDGEDLSEDAKKWMDKAVKTIMSVLNSDASGFVPQVHEFYLDISAFGTGCMYSEPTKEDGRPDDYLYVKTFSIANVMFAENYRGVVDSVWRTQQMTYRQVAQEWGEENLHDSMKRLLKESPDTMAEIMHAVVPREDASRLPGAKTGKEKPFASYWVDVENKHLLSESGYDEQPYNIARWSKSAGELLGRGPGTAALPYIRSLNSMALTAMMAAEKMADPPLIAPDDGFLGPINSGSGGISYYRSAIPGSSGDMIRPLPVNADLPAVQSMIEWRAGQIRGMFLNPQLETFENPNATATQVLAVQAEKMRVLGPVLGRLQIEFLSPFINRVFGILLRAGVIEEAPEELQGKELAVEYKNPISSVQKQAEAQAFLSAVSFVSPVLGAAPNVFDNFDPDEIVRDSQQIFGYPAKYLRSVEDRDNSRARQQQEKQAMTEAALAEKTISVAGQAKKDGLLDE